MARAPVAGLRNTQLINITTLMHDRYK